LARGKGIKTYFAQVIFLFCTAQSAKYEHIKDWYGMPELVSIALK
jgi:hypothetical protein